MFLRDLARCRSAPASVNSIAASHITTAVASKLPRNQLRVDDVFPNGYTLDRATVRQKKTGRPVRFELTEQTRQAIDEYLRLNGRNPGDFLFAGRSDGRGLTTRQYARL